MIVIIIIIIIIIIVVYAHVHIGNDPCAGGFFVERFERARMDSGR